MIGLSAHHIELLTGHPAEQILDMLHAQGITVRTNLGMSPWRRQWLVAARGRPRP